MDHLPAIMRRAEGVPDVGSNDYERLEGGFYMYPQRCNVGTYILSIDKTRGSWTQYEIDSYIQAWLFFGLLDEFSTDMATLPLDNFRATDEDGQRIITTGYLLEYLENWRHNLLSMPESSRKARQMRTVLVLKDAKDAITRYCSAAFPNSVTLRPVDPRIAMSVMVLGETLAWALEQSKIQSKPPIFGWTNIDTHGWGNSPIVIERLLQKGWCPHSIFMLQGLLKGSVSGLCYASSFPDSPDSRHGNRHDSCTPDRCIRDRITEEMYITRHVEPNCSCSFIQPNIEEVLEILENNGIPLLQYTASPQLATIKTEQYKPGMKYIVISHVWADGLGNATGNALVSCQLERLTKLAGKLLDFAGGPVFFWIDSLAVPLSRPHRIIAIRQMHEVYAKAYKTIVLDADLMRNPVGTSYIETAMRITISGWMQRLWTLQEGVMSRSIYFLFEDGLKDIEDLDLGYPEAATKSSVADAARSFYTNLLRPHSITKIVDAKLISLMWKAVQWRKTSKKSDEVRALARILDVEPDELSDCSTEDQMMILLKNMSEIPPAFIFLPGTRLKKAGFRWAPASWLVGRDLEYPDPLSLPVKPSVFARGYDIVNCPSVLTPEGLMVRYPGYLLHSLHPKCFANILHRKSFVFPSCDSLHEWYMVQLFELGDDNIPTKDGTDLGELLSEHDRHDSAGHEAFQQNYYQQSSESGSNELPSDNDSNLGDMFCEHDVYDQTVHEGSHEENYPHITQSSSDCLKNWRNFCLGTLHPAIITCRPKPGITPEIALLVGVTYEARHLNRLTEPGSKVIQNTAIKANVVCRIKISLLTQDKGQRYQQESLKIHPDRNYLGEELEADQLWIVD